MVLNLAPLERTRRTKAHQSAVARKHKVEPSYMGEEVKLKGKPVTFSSIKIPKLSPVRAGHHGADSAPEEEKLAPDSARTEKSARDSEGPRGG